jgi:pyruvate,water dikinase
MWIRPLGDADASCGAKARGLAQLIAAGLRVPDGFVLDSRAFREVAALAEIAPDAIGHALADAGDRIARAALPAALEAEVRAAATALGRLAVRSSASLEDGALGAAAGVFSSMTDVAPEDVWDAIRAVWTSALTPLAVAYARRREAAIEIAVIVQRFVPGTRVTVYTRPVGAPDGDELWIQRGDILQRVPRTAARDHREAVAALAAEAAIGAAGGADVELVSAEPGPAGGAALPSSGPDVELVSSAPAMAGGADVELVSSVPATAGGADVELVSAAPATAGGADVELVSSAPATAGGADVELISAAPGMALSAALAPPWIVQARPMLHPVQRRRRPPPPIVLAPLVRDGRRWTWDLAHNPDPLSPAQAGLVAAVERAACTPYALQVCAGYLYTTPRAVLPPPTPPADRAELAARIATIEARFAFDEPTGPEPDASGARTGAAGAVVAATGARPSVAQAVERYVAFMRIWAGELSPLVAAARQVLLDRLMRDGHPPAQLAARAAALIGPRPVLRDRRMSPAWDVAVPTFAERDAGSEDRSQRDPRARRPRAPLPEPPPDLSTATELARAAADAGEIDDLWFARAQWMVRRALLAHGAALALRDDDVFWLPLDELIAQRPIDVDDAHRRASAARAAHARAAEWDMPHVVHGDAIGGASGDAIEARAQGGALRGVGFGARVVGRVVRFASLSAATAVGPGDVVVTRAITPALAMIVDGCTALVSETGGLLDHGAALARELGIPCVVGCAGAWTGLSDGVAVAVDGDAGLVHRR